MQEFFSLLINSTIGIMIKKKNKNPNCASLYKLIGKREALFILIELKCLNCSFLAQCEKSPPTVACSTNTVLKIKYLI